MPYSQYFSCPRLAADRLWCPVPLQERHPVLSQGSGHKRRCPTFKMARSTRQRAFSFPAEQEDFTILASPSLEPQVYTLYPIQFTFELYVLCILIGVSCCIRSSLLVQVSYGIDDLDDDEPERALLVGVGETNRGRRQGPTYSLDDSLKELGGLAEAAGLKVGKQFLLSPIVAAELIVSLQRARLTWRSTILQVVGSMTQHIQPDAQTYLGPGKVEEMLQMVATVGADTIILDGELSPRQLRNLSRRCSQQTRICDRTALILDIFKQRAFSKEGQLQVWPFVALLSTLSSRHQS